MTAHQPTIHTPPNPQIREGQLREEARRDEQERKRLEEEVFDCDAYSFYDSLSTWALRVVPKPVQGAVHITLLKKRPTAYQPLPVSRAEYRVLYSLSQKAARLVKLLKALEQKGLDCPYVHQLNKPVLEQALAKCEEIKKALIRFNTCSGMVAKLLYLLHRSYVYTLEIELSKFSSRLEAIILMSRHAEFAQDLVRLRRAVTYRTGYVLGPDGAQGSSPKQVLPPRSPQKNKSS